MNEPTQEEVRQTFHEEYNVAPSKPIEVEIDDELGLEVVQKETVYGKYQIYLKKGNPFHESLQSFFDKAGYLTARQLEAIRR